MARIKGKCERCDDNPAVERQVVGTRDIKVCGPCSAARTNLEMDIAETLAERFWAQLKRYHKREGRSIY